MTRRYSWSPWGILDISVFPIVLHHAIYVWMQFPLSKITLTMPSSTTFFALCRYEKLRRYAANFLNIRLWNATPTVHKWNEADRSETYCRLFKLLSTPVPGTLAFSSQDDFSLFAGSRGELIDKKLNCNLIAQSLRYGESKRSWGQWSTSLFLMSITIISITGSCESWEDKLCLLPYNRGKY